MRWRPSSGVRWTSSRCPSVRKATCPGRVCRPQGRGERGLRGGRPAGPLRVRPRSLSQTASTAARTSGTVPSLRRQEGRTVRASSEGCGDNPRVERSRRRDARCPDPRRLLVAVAMGVALVAACGNDSVPSPTGASVASGSTASGSTVAQATPGGDPHSHGDRRVPARDPRPPRLRDPPPRPSPPRPRPASARRRPSPGSQVGRILGRTGRGYIVRQPGARVVCVQARWTEPKLHCPTKGDPERRDLGRDRRRPVAATKARPLIQVGTAGECRDGVERHFALAPALSEPAVQPVVRRGDQAGRPDGRVGGVPEAGVRPHRRRPDDRRARRRSSRAGAEGQPRRAPNGSSRRRPASCPSHCHQLTLPSFGADPVHATRRRRSATTSTASSARGTASGRRWSRRRARRW